MPTPGTKVAVAPAPDLKPINLASHKIAAKSMRVTGTTWRSVTGMILSLMRGATLTWTTFSEIVTFID